MANTQRLDVERTENPNYPIKVNARSFEPVQADKFKGIFNPKYGATRYETFNGDIYSITLDGRILGEDNLDSRLAGKKLKIFQELIEENLWDLKRFKNPEDYLKMIDNDFLRFETGDYVGLVTEDGISHVSQPIKTKYQIVPVETMQFAKNGEDMLSLQQISHRAAGYLGKGSILDFLCRVSNTGAWSLNLSDKIDPNFARRRYTNLAGLTKAICDGVEIAPIKVVLGN